MMRILTVVVGTLAEAWSEVRVHRGRVILSLVGVTVAVASLTAVTGFGALSSAVVAQSTEQYAGREATFSVSVSAKDDAPQPDALRAATAFRDAVARYEITQRSVVQDELRKVQFPGGVREVPSHFVDRPWGTIHSNVFEAGRWFTTEDERKLAPALVVNAPFWEALGSPELSTHPVVEIAPEASSRPSLTGQIVGVVATSTYDTEPQMWALATEPTSSHAAVTTENADTPVPTFEMWLPPDNAQALADRVAGDMRTILGGAATVDVERTDTAGVEGAGDSLQILIMAVSVLVLLLGAVGLLGVSLVSVRQRIRDIGIRRGVGATAPRIFVAVMLENVVGTAVAGAIGVMAAALLMGLPVVRDALTLGLPVTVPPFPVTAALIGMACSVGVGALSGVLPALIAVRVRVVDAIRY